LTRYREPEKSPGPDESSQGDKFYMVPIKIIDIKERDESGTYSS
jgi:hypothetical protein